MTAPAAPASATVRPTAEDTARALAALDEQAGRLHAELRALDDRREPLVLETVRHAVHARFPSATRVEFGSDVWEDGEFWGDPVVHHAEEWEEDDGSVTVEACEHVWDDQTEDEHAAGTPAPDWDRSLSSALTHLFPPHEHADPLVLGLDGDAVEFR